MAAHGGTDSCRDCFFSWPGANGPAYLKHCELPFQICSVADNLPRILMRRSGLNGSHLLHLRPACSSEIPMSKDLVVSSACRPRDGKIMRLILAGALSLAMSTMAAHEAGRRRAVSRVMGRLRPCDWRSCVEKTDVGLSSWIAGMARSCSCIAPRACAGGGVE